MVLSMLPPLINGQSNQTHAPWLGGQDGLLEKDSRVPEGWLLLLSSDGTGERGL